MHCFRSYPLHWAQLRDNSCALQLRVFCFSGSSQQIFLNVIEDFLCPSQKADARFGSSILSLPGAPITRAETEKQDVPKQSSSNRLSRQEPGAQVCQGVRPQVRGSFACDSAVLERCRRRMALQDGVASHRRGTASANMLRLNCARAITSTLKARS